MRTKFSLFPYLGDYKFDTKEAMVFKTQLSPINVYIGMLLQFCAHSQHAQEFYIKNSFSCQNRGHMPWYADQSQPPIAQVIHAH